MQARLAVVSLLWLVAGCFEPSPQPGGACAPGNRCPSPLQCIAAVCAEPGSPVDSVPDARLPDAGPQPPVACPAGYTRVVTGSCHRSFLTGPLSWLGAEARCEQDGAHLVIPDSVAEAKLVPDPSWVGISDRRIKGAFLTVIGRPPAFTYWNAGDPDSSFSCAHTTNASRWQTGPCDFPFPFVCEFDGVKADPTAY